MGRDSGRRALTRPHDPASPPALVRLVGGLSSLGLLAVALQAVGLRDDLGDLDTPFALAASVALCPLLLTQLMGRLPGRALAYLMLFVVGSAAQLQLAHMGPTVSYQHLFTLGELAAGQSWYALVIVGLQALAVAFGALPAIRSVLGFLRARLTGFGLLSVAGVFAMTSATLSREVLNYGVELVMATGLQTLSLLNLWLVLAALPEAALERVGAGLSRVDGRTCETTGLDRFALWGALWVLCVATFLNLVSYESFPHVPDEVVYLYPARYIADGRLWVDLPPAASAFDVNLVFYDYEGGRMWSPVPIGWPMMLSLGVYLGLPWLVNPILGACCVLLCFGFTRRVLGLPAARLILLLMVTSPWFIFLAMSFMTHTSSLFGALLAAYCAARMRDSGRVAWGLLGGVGIGYCSLVRPLEGLAVASTLGLWVLTFKPIKKAILGDGLMALSTVAVGGLALPYNKLFTGDPLYFPIMHYTDTIYGKDSNAMGFGANRGLGWSGLDPFPGHGAIDVVVNTNMNLYAINVELFGWTTGSLALVALLWFGRGMKGFDWAALGAASLIAFLHAFYWFSGGPDFGARYWYMAFVPLLLMAVRAIQWLIISLGEYTGKPEEARTRVQLGVLLLCLTTLMNFMPWRAVDKYHHYRGMRPGLRDLTAELNPGRSLFLVRGNRHPDFAGAFILNPVDFSADVPLYAWDHEAELTRQVVEAHPDRPVYVVDGPTRTGRDYELAAGPLSQGQVTEFLKDNPTP